MEIPGVGGMAGKGRAEGSMDMGTGASFLLECAWKEVGAFGGIRG